MYESLILISTLLFSAVGFTQAHRKLLRKDSEKAVISLCDEELGKKGIIEKISNLQRPIGESANIVNLTVTLGEVEIMNDDINPGQSLIFEAKDSGKRKRDIFVELAGDGKQLVVKFALFSRERTSHEQISGCWYRYYVKDIEEESTSCKLQIFVCESKNYGQKQRRLWKAMGMNTKVTIIKMDGEEVHDHFNYGHYFEKAGVRLSVNIVAMEKVELSGLRIRHLGKRLKFHVDLLNSTERHVFQVLINCSRDIGYFAMSHEDEPYYQTAIKQGDEIIFKVIPVRSLFGKKWKLSINEVEVYTFDKKPILAVDEKTINKLQEGEEGEAVAKTLKKTMAVFIHPNTMDLSQEMRDGLRKSALREVEEVYKKAGYDD